MNIYYLLSGTVVVVFVVMYFGYRSALKYELGKPDIIVPDDAFERMIVGRIRYMDGIQFEEFCAYAFQCVGYKAKITPSSHDFGKDIILNDNVYVECKCYKEGSKINSPMINKLLGACASDGIKKGIFITTSEYTNDCYKILDKTKNGSVSLELWNIHDLIDICEKSDKNSILTWLGYDVNHLNFA